MNDRQTGLFDAPAMLGGFGLNDPRIVCRGDPSRSVLLYRIAKTGSGRMPRIGSDVVDNRWVAMLSQWIAQLPGADSQVAAKGNGQVAADLTAIKAAGGTPEIAAAIDRLIESPSGALALAGAVARGEISGPLREQVINKAVASPLPAIHDLFDRFTSLAARPKLGASFDREKLLATAGNATRGQFVFQSVAQCATCHLAVGISGREYGPDLSHIAGKYNKAQLLENIVEPSKTILEGFATYSVQKSDGDVASGFLVSRNEKEIVIKDPTLQLVHIPASQIKQVKPQTVSAMPEGLLAPLEPQQAADLLEFLLTQK
jgi:putative heme-binding domain-containing protein